MSKYNKQLSVIDSESIATQPDSEGGVNWPEDTFVFQSEVAGYEDNSGYNDPNVLYISDPRFPFGSVYYYWNVPVYQTNNFPDGVEAIQVAIMGSKYYSSTFQPMNYPLIIQFNHPDHMVPPKYNADHTIIVMIQFNKNPFA